MKINRDSLLSYLDRRNIPYSEGKMGIHYAVRISHGGHYVEFSFWPDGEIHNVSIDGWIHDGWCSSISEDLLYTNFIKTGDYQGIYARIINMKYFGSKEKIA